MRKFLLALVLAIILTLANSATVLAGEPPEEKPMPSESFSGLITACAAHGLNQASLYKDNPGFDFGGSVKGMIEYQHLAYGTPVALGWWK